MDLFETGLFTELGEVVGLDPNMYEDISKQPINMTSSDEATIYSQVCGLETFNKSVHSASDEGHLDSLVMEGNKLLDQLMAANGLDLTNDNINLADMDELDFATKASEVNVVDDYLFGQQDHDLLSELYTMSQSSPMDNYPIPDSPMSTISTLASEPSSPVDISTLQQQAEFEFTATPPESDLNNLLQSFATGSITDACNMNPYFDLSSSEVGLSSGMDTSSILDTSTDDNHSDQSFLLDSSYEQSSQTGVVTKAKDKKKKATPYSKLPAGRKERKKQQNKEAAIRYREKKRSEAQVAMDEEAVLARRNSELKSEVHNLEREILCMKDLLSDVFNIHSL